MAFERCTLERRSFLKGIAVSAGTLGAGFTPILDAQTADLSPESAFPPKPARYVTSLPEKKIRCDLCPRKCEVADRERGQS